jgi:Rrf2 family transcriptional regulator, cysteine metabolism repressor
MKISTRPRYALLLMLDISRHTDDEKPIHLGEIADRNNLSRGYLEQLVVSLKNARLIRSFSGRSGGYRLGRPAEQITLLEIFEAIMGPLNLVECVGHPQECLRSEFCECRVLWHLIHLRITHVLADYSLKDLTDKEGVKRMLDELQALQERKGVLKDPSVLPGPPPPQPMDKVQ